LEIGGVGAVGIVRGECEGGIPHTHLFTKNFPPLLFQNFLKIFIPITNNLKLIRILYLNLKNTIMRFIDLFNYKKYIRSEKDQTLARIGHLEALKDYIDSNLSNPLKSAEVTLTKAQINDLHNTTVSFPASQLGVAANEHYKIIIELTEIRTNPDGTGFGQGGSRPGFTMAYNNTPLCTIPFSSFAPFTFNIVSFRPTPIDSIISTVTNAPLTFATSEAITNGGADAEIKIKIFFYTFVP